LTMGCGGSDESETMCVSVVVSATEDCKHQTDAIYEEMVREFSGKGHRGSKAVEKVFEFMELAEFTDQCNRAFLEASGGDNKALNFTEFTKFLLKLLQELLAETAQIGSDSMHYELSPDEAAEWYSKVDSNNSGKIEKGEFLEVMRYFCMKAKLDTAIKMNNHLQKLKEQGDWVDMNEHFRSGGDCTFGPDSVGVSGEPKGFRLCKAAWHQEGHLLCRIPFQTEDKKLEVTLEYMTCAKDNTEPGEGFCVYLVDPSVEGWDTDFDGEGPVGFQGKSGAVVGCFVDIGGKVSGDKNHCCVKGPDLKDKDCVAKKKVDANDIMTDGKWKEIKISFDTDDGEIDFKIDGVKVCDDVKWKGKDGMTLPKNVAVGICGATSGDHCCEIRVHDLRIQHKND